MATVPIEIILQDAETPVDPTPTPEETNIVVPDTGAGTVGSGSTLTGSSAASIILPVILLAVALATVCTLLIHKHRKHQNDKLSRKEKLFTVASSTIAILATTVLVGNLVIPATNAATSVEPGTAELDVADKITITATREADSDTVTATAQNISYATANLDFGYKVTASMAEGTTTANLYLDGNTDSPYYIAPVSDGILTDNTWGYTLSEPTEESLYQSIPLSTKPTNIVKEVAKTVEDTAVEIYYTVQIDKDMPNGTYTGELEYTISPAIEYMQDFSTLTSAEKTATLARMPEGKQYIFKDNRDENQYYISRLKDNNVWMTQNLDLDIDEGTTYTHADTDLGWSDPNNLNPNAKWKPDEGHSTIDLADGTVEGWTKSQTAPCSANPGNVYYYTSGNNDPDTFYNSSEACERVHSDGSCPHYHAGNYYNWTAAVASNDTEEMATRYENAPDSICPAGWRLPVGPNLGDASFSELANSTMSYENILDNNIHSGCGNVCNYYSYLTEGFNAIRTAPLWMNRSGHIRTDSGLIENGIIGYYQLSTIYSNLTGYSSKLKLDRLEPASVTDGDRSYGLSVRCVAR